MAILPKRVLDALQSQTEDFQHFAISEKYPVAGPWTGFVSQNLCEWQRIGGFLTESSDVPVPPVAFVKFQFKTGMSFAIYAEADDVVVTDQERPLTAHALLMMAAELRKQCDEKLAAAGWTLL